jgi:hypothetical protein
MRFRRLGSLQAIGLLALCASTLAFAAPAPASPPTVTVSGSVCEGGDHCEHSASVNATLQGGVATGSLSTVGLVPNTAYQFERFEGTVTCMKVEGKRVTVGAVGRAFEQEWPESELHGLYAQVLSIEFGHYGPKYEMESGEMTSRFRGLGENDKGYPVTAGAYPDCDTQGSFENMWSTPYGKIVLSPEITSPSDGAVIAGPSVVLSGVGQPETLLAVYEAGQSPTGHVIEIPPTGLWSTTFTNVPAGPHVFTASAIDGSKVPANTVEVNVEPLAPTTLIGSATTTTSPTPASGSNATLSYTASAGLSLALVAGGHPLELLGSQLRLGLEPNASGTVLVGGFLAAHRLKHRLPVRAATSRLTAGHAAFVSLGTTSAQRRLIRAERRAHRSVLAYLTLNYTATNGARLVRELTVAVR